MDGERAKDDAAGRVAVDARRHAGPAAASCSHGRDATPPFLDLMPSGHHRSEGDAPSDASAPAFDGPDAEPPVLDPVSSGHPRDERDGPSAASAPASHGPAAEPPSLDPLRAAPHGAPTNRTAPVDRGRLGPATGPDAPPVAARPHAGPRARIPARTAGRTAGRIAGGSLLGVVGGAAVVLALWQGAVLLLAPPPYMLPSPAAVAARFVTSADRLAADTAITLAEIALGLVAGVLLGVATGLLAGLSPLAGRVVGPLLVVSQALPVFALAPLLVLWLGFGLASKVVMAALVIYFPVASALADGLARTEPGLIDLARLAGAGRLSTLALIRLPAALPALVTGIRVAAVFAPIGAVIGEWVGASAGLGLLMVQANARMQTDLLFAALAVLAAVTLVLRAVVERATARLIPWAEADGPA